MSADAAAAAASSAAEAEAEAKHQTDDSGGDQQVKTYTEEEVERRLRGQGKEIERLKADAAKRDAADAKRKAAEDEAERKRLADAGEHKALYEQALVRIASLEGEVSARERRLQEFTERETRRLEAVADANKKALRALPEELRSLVPESLGPDEQSAQIARLAALSGKPQMVDVNSSSGRSVTPESALKAANAAISQHIDKRGKK